MQHKGNWKVLALRPFPTVLCLEPDTRDFMVRIPSCFSTGDKQSSCSFVSAFPVDTRKMGLSSKTFLFILHEEMKWNDMIRVSNSWSASSRKLIHRRTHAGELVFLVPQRDEFLRSGTWYPLMQQDRSPKVAKSQSRSLYDCSFVLFFQKKPPTTFYGSRPLHQHFKGVQKFAQLRTCVIGCFQRETRILLLNLRGPNNNAMLSVFNVYLEMYLLARYPGLIMFAPPGPKLDILRGTSSTPGSLLRSHINYTSQYSTPISMPEKCKNRERLAAATSSGDVPFIPVGAIRGSLCFRCFDPSDNILKCSACKRAGYCSKQCQKLDWSISHKNHCKIFKTINEVEEQQYQRTRSWAEYREYLVSISITFLSQQGDTDNYHAAHDCPRH